MSHSHSPTMQLSRSLQLVNAHMCGCVSAWYFCVSCTSVKVSLLEVTFLWICFKVVYCSVYKCANKMSFFFGNMATGRFPISTSNSFAQRDKNGQERGHQVGRGICCGYHRRSLRVECEGALKSLDTSNSRILRE